MEDDITQAAACLAQGDIARAEQLARAAPPSASAHTLLGRILARRGDLPGAESEFRSALQHAPQHAEAWLAWSALLQDAGQPEQAVICLERALDHLPESDVVHNDLAVVFLRLSRLDKAAHHARRASEIAPQSAAPWFNLGVAYGRQNMHRQAANAFREAVARDPGLAEAHNALGEVLHASNPAEAEAAFHAALAVRPDYAEALANVAGLEVLKGDLPTALSIFDRALDAKPSLKRALAHKTTALFLAGRLPEAWQLYRRRFEAAGFRTDPHGRFPHPRWEGQSLAGKGLVAWTDLGLGEEVLQAGLFNDVLRAGARLTVECSPRLAGLFRRSFPMATVLPRLNPSRACATPIDADYQIAAGDLGAVFRADWASFPKHTGYLAAGQALVGGLRQKYRSAEKPFVVGISWASTRSGLGASKTMSLMDFAPVLRQPGVAFINLQYAADPAEVAAVEKEMGIRISTDPTIDLLGDMDAVAAQTAAMDLVICVSNTAAHLAGALNVPVWNIIPGYSASGMWHWFSGSEASPWYPSMKILRRTQHSNDALMARIAADLAVSCARRDRS